MLFVLELVFNSAILVGYLAIYLRLRRRYFSVLRRKAEDSP